jgi:hypothetical protein
MRGRGERIVQGRERGGRGGTRGEGKVGEGRGRGVGLPVVVSIHFIVRNQPSFVFISPSHSFLHPLGSLNDKGMNTGKRILNWHR